MPLWNCRLLAAALQARGIDIFDDLGVGPLTVNTSDEIEAANAIELEIENFGGRRSKRTNAVCWASTPSHAGWWYKVQHTSIITMWEARKLPEPFRENLHEFDAMVVPSEQNVELFSQYHPNVKCMSLGVDPVEWNFTPRQSGPFFNLLIGGSGLRKGTAIAARLRQSRGLLVFPVIAHIHPYR